MKNNPRSPWDNLHENQQRRVTAKSVHNCFWIKDIEGRLGIYLKTTKPLDDLRLLLSLKGIHLIKRNTSTNQGELFLLLEDESDVEIFYKICQDLITVIEFNQEEERMIESVEARLKKWQNLLKRKQTRLLDFSRQMGLFSELYCLLELILPNYNLEQSINAWVGADFDKQDFLLSNLVLEVKSYKTSNGGVVQISSTKQLISDKNPVFLVCYGITETEVGTKISTLVQRVNKLLVSSTPSIKDLFDQKLFAYGYDEEKSEEYNSFIIDRSRIFRVDSSFPKIEPQNLMVGIVDLNYAIDLATCGEFLMKDAQFNDIAAKK